MKLSSTAIKELSSQYRSVLKKCFILNACILMASAPALAESYGVDVTEDKTYTQSSFSGETAGIYSGSGKTGTFIAEDIIIKNTGRGIWASGMNSKIVIGSQREFTDSLTISGITANGRGIRADSSGVVEVYAEDVIINATSSGSYGLHTYSAPENIAGRKKTNPTDFTGNDSIDNSDIVSKISINAENVDIKSKDVAAVIANNSYIHRDSEGNLALDKGSKSEINITADKINISSDTAALSAMSMGIVNISGNTSLTAQNVIQARGFATININTAKADADKTLKMNGDINFSYDEKTSGSAIDANINVNLNGTASYWNGNTTKTWDGSPDDKLLEVSNATVTLNDGAAWNVTEVVETDTLKQIALNNLIVNKGTISVGSKAKAWIEKMQVNGDLTLNGSVIADSVVFANNSSLTTTLMSETAIITAGKVEVGQNVYLNISNGAGTYAFIDGTLDGTFLNALYDLDTKTEAGKIIVSTKSTEKIVEDLGVTENAGETISALVNSGSENEKAKEVAALIEKQAQAGNTAAVEKIVENINPIATPAVQTVSTEVNGQIMNLVGARMAPAASGRSGGDYKVEAGGVWAKSLYNKSKQDGAFHGYTQGVAMGIDSVIEDVFTIGVGYAYNATDVKADARKTNIYGHNFFVYGEYQPNQWFVNSALSYSNSDYEEQKELAGTEAKYTVETYGAQVMTGYDFNSGLTPQAGLKYLNIKQDSHSDGLTYVSTKDTNLLTAVAGVNYAKELGKGKVTVTPEVRLAATYDVVSKGTTANVVLGSSSYTVNGQRLPRFGVEAGLGLEMNIAETVNINVDYDISVRRDYTSHTGTVSLKYNF